MPDARKLATIVSIDVAGYSRAAEADDAKAASAVHALREAAARIAEPIGGRIFNTAGDGVMLEFPAASSAVQAALALLEETRSGAFPLPQIRIGVHMGEVIVAPNGDLLGHGVNVAARLQQLADPGAALVSDTVRAQVRSASDVDFVSRGRVQLDKMSERLGVYALGPDKPLSLSNIGKRRFFQAGVIGAVLVALAALIMQMATPRPTGPMVLAMLPFAPEDTSEAAGLFSGAFSTELHFVLSQSPGDLALIGYSSSYGYASDPRSVQQLRSQLKVDVVLDGAVSRTDQTIAATVELIDARTGGQIWQERFEDDFTNLYAMQLQIARRVREALRLKKTEQVQSAPIDPAALRLYMSTIRSDTALPDARSLSADIAALEQAVQIAPKFGRAWYRLAFAYSIQRYTETSAAGRDRAAKSGERAARRYLELEPSDPRAHYWAGEFESNPRRRAELLIEALKRGADDADVLSQWSQYVAGAGRVEEAFRMANRAATIDPYSDFITSRLSWRSLALPDLDIAERLLRSSKMVMRAPTERWAALTIGWLAIDEPDRAQGAWRQLERVTQSSVAAALREKRSVGEIAAAKRLLDDLSVATRAGENAASRARAQALMRRLAAEGPSVPAPLFYSVTLPLASVVGGADTAFALWSARLEKTRPDSQSGVAPDAETAALFQSWPWTAYSKLHRDPRFFAMLARYPLYRNVPYPDDQGVAASNLALMASRPPDFCRETQFPYDCAATIKAALAAQ